MRWCQTLGQKAGLIADLLIPHWGVLCVCAVPAMAVGECDAYGYDLRTRRQGLRSSRDPDVWKVRIFVDGIPANGFTYSVDSEVYQDAAIDGVPEDLVAAEKATDDDIAAEIDKFKP
jgi:hypothetical protein